MARRAIFIFLRLHISRALKGNITDIVLSTVSNARVQPHMQPKRYVAKKCTLQPPWVKARMSIPKVQLIQCLMSPVTRLPVSISASIIIIRLDGALRKKELRMMMIDNVLPRVPMEIIMGLIYIITFSLDVSRCTWKSVRPPPGRSPGVSSGRVVFADTSVWLSVLLSVVFVTWLSNVIITSVVKSMSNL